MTKFKYENVIFMGLVGMFIVGAFERDCSLLTNIATLSTQIFMCLGVKDALRYVRRNAKAIKKEVATLLIEN